VTSFASKRSMAAPGAMACAHSTSSDSSNSQPPEGSTGTLVWTGLIAWPFWLNTLRNDAAGPNCWYSEGLESLRDAPNC